MEFRDLSAVGSILRAHSLLSVVPAASLYWPEARAAIQDVLATLLAFTQPSLQPNKVVPDPDPTLLSPLESDLPKN
jgi:hypothetical protein